MQPLRQRGVPQSEHESPGAASATPDWESIHVFLEVVRKGSFRSAADQLGQSINAVRRRICGARAPAWHHASDAARGRRANDGRRGGNPRGGTQDGSGIFRSDQSARSSRPLSRWAGEVGRHGRTGNVLAGAAAGRASTFSPEAVHRPELRDALGGRRAIGSRRGSPARQADESRPENRQAWQTAFDAICSAIVHRFVRRAEDRRRRT